MVSCAPAPSVGLSGDDDNDLPVERTYALGPRVPALEGLDRPEQVALEPRPDERELLRIRLPASPLGLSREVLKLATNHGDPAGHRRTGEFSAGANVHILRPPSDTNHTLEPTVSLDSVSYWLATLIP